MSILVGAGLLKEPVCFDTYRVTVIACPFQSSASTLLLNDNCTPFAPPPASLSMLASAPSLGTPPTPRPRPTSCRTTWQAKDVNRLGARLLFSAQIPLTFDSNHSNSPSLESWGWWDLNQSLQALSLGHRGVSVEKRKDPILSFLLLNQDLFGNPLPRPTGYKQNISLCTTCAFRQSGQAKCVLHPVLGKKRAVRLWGAGKRHLPKSLVVLCSFLPAPSLCFSVRFALRGVPWRELSKDQDMRWEGGRGCGLCLKQTKKKLFMTLVETARQAFL